MERPIAIGYEQRPEDEKRRQLEQEILAFFECPKCGEDDAPFLDCFALDFEIECSCGHSGRLSAFISEDINAY